MKTKRKTGRYYRPKTRYQRRVSGLNPVFLIEWLVSLAIAILEWAITTFVKNVVSLLFEWLGKRMRRK